MKRIYFLLLFIFLTSCSNTHVNKKSLSGEIEGDVTWSGDIFVSGDLIIKGNLFIEPGTKIIVDNRDSQNKGEKFPADDYNKLDPTRLEKYEKSHTEIEVKGNIFSVGTLNNPIIFTSASKYPANADWVSLTIHGGNSSIAFNRIEWSREGIVLLGSHLNSNIYNNFINNSFWSAISSGVSNANIVDNEIWNCGHEGIDIQGGRPYVINNKVYESHTGIVILGGSPVIINNTFVNVGDDIHIQNSKPLLKKNNAKIASKNKLWTYNKFSYQTFGQPIIS